MDTSREPQVIDTFLTLTDTLTRDFDAVDMLTTLSENCVRLLDVSAAGVILADGRGGLSMAAASSERSRLLGIFAVAIDSGPCVDCVRIGESVASDDLARASARLRWPRYTAGAQDAGFRATHALPMRLRDEVIGVLTLLHTDRHTLTAEDARLGQALADAATIGLMHERAIRRAEAVQEQLQGALESRVIIEQAKGVLAGSSHLSPEAAFAVLRSHARANGIRLTQLARDVVDGSIDFTSIIRPAL